MTFFPITAIFRSQPSFYISTSLQEKRHNTHLLACIFIHTYIYIESFTTKAKGFEMGRGFKPKGGRGRGRGRGYAAQQQQEEEWRAQQARKRRGEEESSSEEEETSDEDEDGKSSSSSSGDEEEKNVKVKEFDRFAGIGVQEEEEEESSDEDDSSSSSSFEDEYLKPKAKPKPKEVDDAPPTKSAKQMTEEMEKLRIVRERRAAQAKARIEAEGFDRYAPPEAGGRPRVE